MPPLGECPRRIAPADAMVDDFEKKKKKKTKTQLLSSFLTVDQRKKVSIFKTQGPSTNVATATSSLNCNHYATSQPEQYRLVWAKLKTIASSAILDL